MTRDSKHEPRIGVLIHQGKTLGAGTPELRAILAEHGHADPPWAEVLKSKHAPGPLTELVEAGCDRILVWGGDGTVRRAIQTIVDGKLDAAVGILPAGTANLLAHNLGIPIDLRGATEVALTAEAHPLDLGRLDDTCFAVMGGAGFDAAMIRYADQQGLKERLGPTGYVWSAIRATGDDPVETTIDIDGHRWFEGPASCVLVANVGRILGGLDAFPAASPTDGRLDVGVIRARSKPEWLRLLARSAAGRAERSPLVEVATFTKLKVRFDRKLPWEVDGGDRGKTDRFKVRCLPAAVRICRPEEAGR